MKHVVQEGLQFTLAKRTSNDKFVERPPISNIELEHDLAVATVEDLKLTISIDIEVHRSETSRFKP